MQQRKIHMPLYDKTKLPTGMVVRPSGIWNSRAPMHTYIKVTKAETRAYEIGRLSLEKAAFGIDGARENGVNLEDYIVPKNDLGRRAWKVYSRAYMRRNREGVIQNPSYGHVKHDLIMSAQILRFTTLIRSVTNFESYVNCWVLNHVLSKLELGDTLHKGEASFAQAVSPVHGGGVPQGIGSTIAKIPDIAVCLSEAASQIADSDNENTHSYLDHVYFWIHYRNCIIHNGGLCTPRAFNRHEGFWNACMKEFARDKFVERYPLTLSFELLDRCRFSLYKSVELLEQKLRTVSSGRRGHSWAPAQPPEKGAIPPADAPEMLMDGDHELSLRWHTNPEFRAQFVALSALLILAVSN